MRTGPKPFPTRVARSSLGATRRSPGRRQEIARSSPGDHQVVSSHYLNEAQSISRSQLRCVSVARHLALPSRYL
jgi:hypothetical protein